jgi:hypothetical protein
MEVLLRKKLALNFEDVEYKEIPMPSLSGVSERAHQTPGVLA